MELNSVEDLQRAHYDKIGLEYEKHYGDRWSMDYREEFLCAPMFIGVDLKGKLALDALCGGGQLAFCMQRMGAQVHGLDISAVQIQALEEHAQGITATVGSVFEIPYEDNTFDAVGVCNALHHLHPHIDKALEEIHRVLKPGGVFGFSEPAANTATDYLRRLWYRLDPLFEESEEAVDLEALKASTGHLFEHTHETYLGNVAYLAVLNSMILRVPHSLKGLYSPALIALERVLNKVLPRFFACAVVCSWRKI